MIPLTAAEVAALTEGALRGVDDAEELVVTSADTDSRAMTEGSLFVAKPGETTDGHRFIDSALAAGARLVLAERETDDPDGGPHPAVLVDDVVLAMGRLAAGIVDRIRAHSPTTVIGITGSAGKTTTKDLLRAVLEAEGPTVAPQGSYNGEVGVPLTVFTAALETRFLVVEMGADGPGNIRYLSEMVRPDVGAVLMVGSAHAGKFGGTDRIAAVKQELVEAVPAQGRVILNADDAQVRAMAEVAAAPITWLSVDGEGPGGPTDDVVAARGVTLDEAGRAGFDLHLGTAPARRLTSGLTGAHHVTNVLAAAAAARAVGVAAEDVAARLDGRGPSSRWRMERTERADGVTVINDAYNANPESMREALRTLATIARAGRRRSVAVLGAMLELGDESIMRHTQLGETVVRLNIAQTLVVGDEAYPLYRGAVAEGSWGTEVLWVATSDEAEQRLREILEPGDVVLFKSSNSAGLRLLGDRIAADTSSGGHGEDDRPAGDDHEGKAGAAW
ncbi:MAG: UDP-N-acetylmuramoyl-tripeptide--D-alanyl-D-alanine ligase [Nesterenkonia sp.]|nr:UDP-N-acetylmuramoyl-tripeptide--D-alanyl-D-alanine ligase [Nesterenkonia sp.]